MTRSVLAVVWVGAALAAGCQGDDRVGVEGTVTYDGRPVPDGAVLFTALDGQGLNAGAPIRDGKFHVDAPFGPKPGRYRVILTWAKPTGKKVRDSYGVHAETVEGLPEKYNAKSDLEAVFTRGVNRLEYQLPK